MPTVERAKRVQTTGVPLDNKRHEAFVREYVKNGRNATHAYMAIYGEKSLKVAGVNGSRLLGTASVQQRLDMIEGKLTDAVVETEVDLRKLVLARLKKIGLRKIDLNDLKVTEQLAALDKMCRVLGMYDSEGEAVPTGPLVQFNITGSGQLDEQKWLRDVSAGKPTE